MTTAITMHANTKKMLREAIAAAKTEGRDILQQPDRFGYKVAMTFGDHISEDAATDYRFHETVVVGF